MRIILSITLLAVNCPVASTQVVIQQLERDGNLAWTNHVSAPSPLPVYRIERATNITGPWQTIGTVTNQNSINTHDGTTNVSWSAFHRVQWVNGQVWNLRFGGPSNSSVTGKLYIASSFNSGTWYLTNWPGGTPWRFTGKGTLTRGLGGNLGTITIEFGSQVVDYSDFWLEGPWPVTNPWYGDWYEQGIGWQQSGRFIAERTH
jgi:hypothetical protein